MLPPAFLKYLQAKMSAEPGGLSRPLDSSV